MKRFIFLLTITFLLLSCKKSEAQLDFVTEYWLAQNFTPKSGITPGTNNTLWMDCDQVLARYQVTISGTTSTGHRFPSKSEISSSVVYVTCGEVIYKNEQIEGTTTYTYDVDFGSSSGLTVINILTYNSPDLIEVYQNGSLKATSTTYADINSYYYSSPSVTQINSYPMRFKYDVENGRYGQIKVTTQSIYKHYRIFFECNSISTVYNVYAQENKSYSYLFNTNQGTPYYVYLTKNSGNGCTLYWMIGSPGDEYPTDLGTVNSSYLPYLGTTNGYGYKILDVALIRNDLSTPGSYNVSLLGCGNAPTTSISSVSSITSESAYVTYTASSDCPIARAICYSSTNTNPTTSDSHTTYTSETGSSTVQLTGLTPSTTYYLRSVANNAKGTTYSTATSFTTQAAQPYTGIIDLSVTYEEDPQYYDVTFTATAQSAVQMNTTVYLAYTDLAGGTIYNTVVIPSGSTSSSVIMRYYRNAQYDVSCDFDNSYSVDFTYGTHPVYVTIPAL